MRAAKNTIKFRSRKQSVKGIIAFVIAAFALAASIAMLVVVSSLGGETGILTGVAALLLTLLAAVGFSLALKALYERDILTGLPIAALLLNGFVVIFYLCTYVIGI